MIKPYFILIIFTLLLQTRESVYSRPLADEIEILDFESFESYLNKQNDTVYIINFFATWCIPCREEMPDFVTVSRQFTNQKVRFIFVSLDFPGQVQSRLIPFIQQYKIRDEVILLDDPDQNAWIDRVSPSWSGGIPATLIYKGNNRTFLEKSLSQDELRTHIHEKLN